MIDIQWPLVLFSLIAGSGGIVFASASLAGVLRKSGIQARFVATIVAMVMLVVGGCLSLLHLALPQNVMAAITNIFGFSGISIELVLLGSTLVVAFIYAIILKREVSDTVRNVVGIIGIVLGVLLAFFCGHGYVMDGRPLWNIELLPLAYLGTAAAAGALVFGLIQTKLGDQPEDIAGLGKVFLGAAVLALVTVAAFVIFLAVNGGLVGSALAFAIATLVFNVVALACAVTLLKAEPAKQAVFLGAGAASALVAGLLLRCLMWATSVGFLSLFEIAETTRTIFF